MATDFQLYFKDESILETGDEIDVLLFFKHKHAHEFRC